MEKETQKIDYQRQTGLFNPEENQSLVNIIGAGNIGSHVAMGIAKLGIRIISVYDFDIVELHNLSSQFYGFKDLGGLKAVALKKHIKDFTGTEILINGRYVRQTVPEIVIIAVDSMKERERIGKVLLLDKTVDYIIDGRMGGNSIEVYIRENAKDYLETIEESVQSVPCSERYISYTSLLCAGIITNQVKKIVNGETYKRNILLDVDQLRFI